ncbi:MAG: tetraacyldisaccharide 4'-kinase [Hyphomicrobiales bacterium]|nr:tetraacyldisaccharide 4'-kinase [Hyphomicrobiales bacterium]
MREPAFWWRPPAAGSRLLAPLAALYGAVAAQRLRRQGQRAACPVVCIGNPTVGGAGKTPTALAVARMLAAAGKQPVFLTRGYGGVLAGPVEVDVRAHRARDVGDEPLLLARAARTIVAHDRVAGARHVPPGSIIVMDDGFQNPSLTKDVAVLVVDARRGIGNGRVIPAGPLRAPLALQLARADVLILIGTGSRGAAVAAQARAQGIAVLTGRLAPDDDTVRAHAHHRVLAFSGIGDPDKFFATLNAAGIAIGATRAFPDHHRYSAAEARALVAEAERLDLVLLTTEKDLVRMAGDDQAAMLAARARALPVSLVLDDPAALDALLLSRVAQGAR